MIDYLKKIRIETFFLAFTTFLVICVTPFKIKSYDMWWHLKSGEWIIKNGKIPTTDIFSWYGMSNHFSWTAHEWLTDVTYFGIYKFFNFQGLLIFTYLLWFAVFFMFASRYKDSMKHNFSLSCLWFLLFACSNIFSFYVRPQSISFLLLSIQYLILLDYIEGNQDRLILIPLISLLIVNFHGGIAISSFIMIFLIIITNAFNIEIGKIKSTKLESRKLIKLVKTLILTILISFINPIGYKALTYPFLTMKNTFFMNYISEWASADFHSSNGLILVIFFMLNIFAMLLANKKIKLQHLCIFILYFYSSLKYSRMLPYFIFYTTPIYFYYLEDIDLKRIIQNLRIYKMNKIKENKNREIKSEALTKIIILIMCFIFSVIYYPQRKDDFYNPISKEIYPVEGIEILKKYHPQKLYNHYNLGGYLIFTLHDEGIFPFIDGRADLFAHKGQIDHSTVFEDYIKVNNVAENTNKILKIYDIDSIFTLKDSPLTQYLKVNNKWCPIYEDHLIVFFIRKENQINDKSL